MLPVAWVRLACHEPVVDKRVHEPSHRSRRHVQRFGKNTLRDRAALSDLPEQMGVSARERERNETAMSSEAESAQANVALVVESVEALNAGHTKRLLSVMAPDFVMHLAEFPEPLGRDAWREGFEMMRRAFPDLEAQIEDIIAADDKVAARLMLHGTHQGEFQGIPATGRTIHYVSHEFYRVEDGLVAEEWICSDTASVFRQLTE